MINLTKKQLVIIVGISLAIIFVIGYYIYNLNQEESYEQLDIISEKDSTKITENVENDEEEIVVHIAGEIKNPGIVRIKEGARIIDAIDKAGGLTENANITNINLAYVIEDGQKITIPSKNNVDENTDESKETKEYIVTQTDGISNPDIRKYKKRNN